LYSSIVCHTGTLAEIYALHGSASLFTWKRAIVEPRERHREREKREREREREATTSHKSQQPGALFERRRVKNQKGTQEEEEEF
jgi:hypothetical protein